MSETMTNKPEPVVFNKSEPLLIAMIKGRHFEFEGYYYFFYKDNNFKQLDISRELDIGTTFNITVEEVCKVLVGGDLIEIEPMNIPVNTLLIVSDDPEFATTKRGQKRYFSHWVKGEVVTFLHGATAMTQQGTEVWKYWKFAHGTAKKSRFREVENGRK